jgi:hypothetical protein
MHQSLQRSPLGKFIKIACDSGRPGAAEPPAKHLKCHKLGGDVRSKSRLQRNVKFYATDHSHYPSIKELALDHSKHMVFRVKSMATEQILLRNDQSPDGLKQLKLDLLKCLAQGDVTLESSELQSVSFPLIQLLVSAQFESASGSSTLRITVPSGGILDQALDSFGMRDAFPLRPVVENEEWKSLIRIGDRK